MVYVEVNAEDSTTTFFVAEDRGTHLHRLSAKEIKTAKQVIEETFQPSHSIDGHAGTIVNSGGYRIDLQGYVNNCGTKWANVQLQYGVRRPGSSNILLPSLEHRVAVWVRIVPATPDELKGAPFRDDFVKT